MKKILREHIGIVVYLASVFFCTFMIYSIVTNALSELPASPVFTH